MLSEGKRVWNSVFIRRSLRPIPLSVPFQILLVLRRGSPGPVFPPTFGSQAPPPLRGSAPPAPLSVAVAVSIPITTVAVTVTITTVPVTVTIPVSVSITVSVLVVVTVVPFSAAGRTA